MRVVIDEWNAHVIHKKLSGRRNVNAEQVHGSRNSISQQLFRRRRKKHTRNSLMCLLRWKRNVQHQSNCKSLVLVSVCVCSSFVVFHSLSLLHSQNKTCVRAWALYEMWILSFTTSSSSVAIVTVFYIRKICSHSYYIVILSTSLPAGLLVIIVGGTIINNFSILFSTHRRELGFVCVFFFCRFHHHSTLRRRFFKFLFECSPHAFVCVCEWSNEIRQCARRNKVGKNESVHREHTHTHATFVSALQRSDGNSKKNKQQ